MEHLESRHTPSTFFGTDGIDLLIMTETISVLLSNNGSLSIAYPSSEITTFDLLGGDDAVYITRQANLTINLGEGNDNFYLDGAEGGGNFYIDGGNGNDTIISGSGNDSIVGGNGLDSLISGNGDDIVLGGWGTAGSIIEASQTVQADTYEDIIDYGSGFDAVFNDSVRSIYINTISTNVYTVSTSTEFASALNAALPGDAIYLSGGLYEMGLINKNLAGITIMGNDATVRGYFMANNQGLQNRTLIKELNIDISGLTSYQHANGNAFNHFTNGNFYLDNVEVYGIAQNKAAAVYFSALSNTITRGYITNSYLHNTNDDIVSTGGFQANAASLLTIYDTVGHTAGNSNADQVLTTHQGFNMVVVGGHYYDAQINVIATNPDANIDLYFVQTSYGNRSGGIYIPRVGSVIYGCTINSNNYINLYGRMEYSTLNYYGAANTAIFAYQGATVNNNYLTNYGGTAHAIRVLQNNVSIIDNVFTDWQEPWSFLGGIPHIISGNIIQ